MKTAAFSAIAVASASALSSEFTSGFTKGIFMKDQAQFDAFECPAAVMPEDLSNILNMVQPMMNMMKGMNKDGADNDTIEKIVQAGTEYAKVMAIFNDYEGGDFCQGLLASKEAQSVMYKVMAKFMESDKVAMLM